MGTDPKYNVPANRRHKDKEKYLTNWLGQVSRTITKKRTRKGPFFTCGSNKSVT